jgi:hypothetical protein
MAAPKQSGFFETYKRKRIVYGLKNPDCLGAAAACV